MANGSLPWGTPFSSQDKNGFTDAPKKRKGRNESKESKNRETGGVVLAAGVGHKIFIPA
jgi:hypothetical protein